MRTSLGQTLTKLRGGISQPNHTVDRYHIDSTCCQTGRKMSADWHWAMDQRLRNIDPRAEDARQERKQSTVSKVAEQQGGNVVGNEGIQSDIQV